MSASTTAPSPAPNRGAAICTSTPRPQHAPAWALWRTTEVSALRALYPAGGSQAVHEALPHRTRAAIRSKAQSCGIERSAYQPAATAGMRFARLYPLSEHVDNAIRIGYAHATRKGDIKALAQRIGRPPWWVQKRAAALGVTRSNCTRLDCWTRAELQILERWAMCTPQAIRRKLLRAGFTRSETAIGIKLRRADIDREDPDRWSATAVAPMLGVNPATVADWVERRGLPAERVGGGRGTLMITRRGLRNWIARNPRYVDLRRVDQPWFMDLLFGAAGIV